MNRTERITADAKRFIAGGVVSLNRKVDPTIIFERATGSKIVDVEGKEYIDYHAAFAPHLLGHNHPYVNEAVQKSMRSVQSLFGSSTTEWEVTLSQLLMEVVPSLQRIQIANNGSEATAHAIRLSRAWTKRDDIILILGGYNGWHNEVSRTVMPSLDQTGPYVSPGEYPFIASSAGIPEATKQKVHIVNFNDLESVEFVMKRYPVACVLTEPVLQNIGIVLPDREYLQGLIDLCEKYGAVCVFDEVKTGFRSALGGYQSVANVKPHLSVFGKALSNGYPLGAIGGRKEIMDLFDDPDPAKRVLIAGTYNAHPFNTAAAIATIEFLKRPGVYEHITAMSERLYSGLRTILKAKGKPFVLSSNASAYCIYFCEQQPRNLHDILKHHDFAFDLKLRKALINEGIYHIPIACKQGSVSYSHSAENIDRTLDVTEKVLKHL
jgi:glutamate-1-semialdehyde 2,1-aminomutase